MLSALGNGAIEVRDECFHTELQVYRFDAKGLECFTTEIEVILETAAGWRWRQPCFIMSSSLEHEGARCCSA